MLLLLFFSFFLCQFPPVLLLFFFVLVVVVVFLLCCFWFCLPPVSVYVLVFFILFYSFCMTSFAVAVCLCVCVWLFVCLCFRANNPRLARCFLVCYAFHCFVFCLNTPTRKPLPALWRRRRQPSLALRTELRADAHMFVTPLERDRERVRKRGVCVGWDGHCKLQNETDMCVGVCVCLWGVILCV